KRELRKGRAVTSAMTDAGYGSSSRFYERAVPKLGMSPSLYRRGGGGALIRYAIVASPLGRMLVAATARGVCSIALGASDADLERGLLAEYAAASIVKDKGTLARWTAAILRHLNGGRGTLDLPLDIRATAF